MPEIEAIQSATVEAAKLAGNYDILGSIEVGKLADIIAVREINKGNISDGSSRVCDEKW